MRAVRVHEYGSRPSVDDIDEPRLNGPLDVLVEIGAAGLCRTDLHVVEGQWADIQHPDLPYVIGHENAGWVREVGSAVTNVAPGDAVILHPVVSCGLCPACRRGDDVHCADSTFPGLNVDGGMAELMVTNARAVVRLAEGLEPKDVAALADAGLTAYHAVRKAVPLLPPGSHVVVIGAGGLGHIGVQTLTALTPATITVVDPSADALALSREHGASHTVQSSDRDEVAGQIADLTGGGADVVLDFVGESGTELTGPGLLRNHGSYFVIGYGGEVRLPTIEVISREINVIGNLVGSYTDLTELMALTAQGRVSLHTRDYPLEQVNDAMDDLEAGRLVGRGILIPGSRTD